MFRLYDKINRNEVYFIAEMSANHGGSTDNALEIVRRSAKAGADCIKIQTYTADSMTIDCDMDYFKICGGLWDNYMLYDLYENACTPYEWQGNIKEECEKCGIDFLSTPFSCGDVDFLESLNVEAYKIASYELVDLPLIEYTASKGKPVLISVGMGNLEEIQEAVDACKRVENNQIVLLKCCSEYPSVLDDMKLGNIPDMMKKFYLPVGLSDHSPGSLGAVVGVSLGACVIEKHVRIEGVQSADSGFSMPMEEYAAMVEKVKMAKKIMAGPDYSVTAGEEASIVFRRSIFAVKDIEAGQIFSTENVRIIRPGYGLKPKYYNKLIGRSSKRNIVRGQPIQECDL